MIKRVLLSVAAIAALLAVVGMFAEDEGTDIADGIGPELAAPEPEPEHEPEPAPVTTTTDVPEPEPEPEPEPVDLGTCTPLAPDGFAQYVRLDLVSPGDGELWVDYLLFDAAGARIGDDFELIEFVATGDALSVESILLGDYPELSSCEVVNLRVG